MIHAGGTWDCWGGPGGDGVCSVTCCVEGTSIVFYINRILQYVLIQQIQATYIAFGLLCAGLSSIVLGSTTLCGHAAC